MIIFKKLKWKNFLSTGKTPTEIDFTDKKMTLICGENGSGKSTFLDALTFSLFGKSFRGINIPQLPNSINQKDCVTEIEFSIGNKEYKVKRGLKPKIFEIYQDGDMIPQSSKSDDYQNLLEERILKMPFKSFCQVVILGSSNYIPFMKLTAADRRSVVESLLDIDIFSLLNVTLKSKVSKHKDELVVLEKDIAILKERTEAQLKIINKIKESSDSVIDGYQKEIEDTQSDIEKISRENKKLLKSIDTTPFNKQKEISETLSSLSEDYVKEKQSISSIMNQIGFYETNDICPSCSQDICEKHKTSLMEENNNKKEALLVSSSSILDKMNSLKEELIVISTEIKEIESKQRKINENDNSIVSHQKYITQLQYRIKEISGRTDEYDTEKKLLDDTVEEGKIKAQDHSSIKEIMTKYDIISLLLKDAGIKSRIIKYYLPIMNKMVNKYLASMGFFCKFELDETFKETIKSRHRDEFSYFNFSEGERMRIDLSLLLAWREVARSKNSINCNLLILDEIFDSSLDSAGTEEFMKLLRSADLKSSIFVISHKSDQLVDKFDRNIKFTKKNNFSKAEII